ncbi:uncharacterized protein TRIADDRAFT_57908 [Trichoplax adhaerens]|uniref:Uncharacterized protein n=1 Tax=Trichoplax adhaerens TaxID=10228 RepID=B3S232_TRIAD|nr:predicted protein [Trichoplax adhaerens]EDV23044.1 predicted protein [Trichoplax adhaerens]|eukprot:XP_002113954.1 predicted protein [Trichoplax adhaerens]
MSTSQTNEKHNISRNDHRVESLDSSLDNKDFTTSTRNFEMSLGKLTDECDHVVPKETSLKPELNENRLNDKPDLQLPLSMLHETDKNIEEIELDNCLNSALSLSSNNTKDSNIIFTESSNETLRSENPISNKSWESSKVFQENSDVVLSSPRLFSNDNQMLSKNNGRNRDDSDSGLGFSPKRVNMELMRSFESDPKEITHTIAEDSRNFSSSNTSEEIQSSQFKDRKLDTFECKIQQHPTTYSNLESLMLSFREKCKGIINDSTDIDEKDAQHSTEFQDANNNGIQVDHWDIRNDTQKRQANETRKCNRKVMTPTWDSMDVPQQSAKVDVSKETNKHKKRKTDARSEKRNDSMSNCSITRKKNDVGEFANKYRKDTKPEIKQQLVETVTYQATEHLLEIFDSQKAERRHLIDNCSQKLASLTTDTKDTSVIEAERDFLASFKHFVTTSRLSREHNQEKMGDIVETFDEFDEHFHKLEIKHHQDQVGVDTLVCSNPPFSVFDITFLNTLIRASHNKRFYTRRSS